MRWSREKFVVGGGQSVAVSECKQSFLHRPLPTIYYPLSATRRLLSTASSFPQYVVQHILVDIDRQGRIAGHGHGDGIGRSRVNFH